MIEFIAGIIFGEFLAMTVQRIGVAPTKRPATVRIKGESWECGRIDDVITRSIESGPNPLIPLPTPGRRK